MVTKTVLASCVAMVLLVGCKPKEAASVETPPATDETQAPAATPAPVAQLPEAAPAAPAVTVFDINRIPVSDKPLPAWPYVALPAGYRYGNEDLAAQSKDLARVPFWTGSQLLWVEGKTFEAELRAGDGKTYSRFEMLKGIDQALTALGAVTLTQRSYDETVFETNKAELGPFRSEFDDIDDAYWYDKDARTYLIRRADKAIWVVVYSDNYNGAVLVAEGPLPEAPSK